MYFLDTDTLSRFHVGTGTIVDRIKEVGEENVATTIVTTVEILRGRHEYLLKAADGEQLMRAQQLLDFSQELLGDIQIVLIDAGAAAAFDKLRHNKKLRKIGRADVLIASIALSHRAVLVTRNVRHFSQVPGLRIENWLQ